MLEPEQVQLLGQEQSLCQTQMLGREQRPGHLEKLRQVSMLGPQTRLVRVKRL